jgi:hypothetical protein
MPPRQAVLWFASYLAVAVALAGAMLWVGTLFPELRAFQSVMR